MKNEFLIIDINEFVEELQHYQMYNKQFIIYFLIVKLVENKIIDLPLNLNEFKLSDFVEQYKLSKYTYLLVRK